MAREVVWFAYSRMSNLVVKVLFTYHIIPQTITSIPPTRFDGPSARIASNQTFSDLNEKVEKQQSKEVQPHDSSKPLRTFI